MDVKDVVQRGYSERATSCVPAMGIEAVAVCRANGIAAPLLANIPQEVIDRDFGCGNPTGYARVGDTVLDLGSGSGKICYALAQIVGASGRVIGVDMNPDMLDLARRNLNAFRARTGLSNVTFLRGQIEDLRLDLDRVDAGLAGHTVQSFDDLYRLTHQLEDMRTKAPLIPDETVDLVVSNCVINLVETGAKDRVWSEIFRVLRPGGRIALSDNVSSADLPDDLRNDPELWAGCYAGVYQEQAFYEALRQAGFAGLTIVDRTDVPEKKIGDVEFRSVTVTAVKPPLAAPGSGRRTAIYRGPFESVTIDGGMRLARGVPTTLTSETAALLMQPPFRDHVDFAEEAVNRAASQGGCCSPGR